ncbi:hypothetical protein ElyMa_002042100 [Elysia marginata]|uniref:Uncharacterized protein n=1 Tax=Elysia marginata TaxID=1093978 RepID=A0AAV4F6Y3_9GAST|nr:hypothetical protein ElyMa_002042100 [Elysia marginata]
MDRYLDVVSELACLNNPESYAGRSFMLLVGPPKPDRSKDRGQTRHGPPHPPTWNSQGTRKKGRPQGAWRKSVETDRVESGKIDSPRTDVNRGSLWVPYALKRTMDS